MKDVDVDQGFALDLYADVSDLTGADAATFAVRPSAGATPSVSKSATINTSLKRLVVSLTGSETAALGLGSHLAAFAVRFGGATWYTTEPFRLNVRAPIGVTS